MLRKFIFLTVLYCFSVSVALGRNNNESDIIVITVCGVPSLILYHDKKTRNARITPAFNFFTDPDLHKLANYLLKMPKEKIKTIDAALWAVNKKHQCGIAI